MTDVIPRLTEYSRRLADEGPQTHHDLLDLECVNRVTHLPLVASVLDYAQGVYESAKDSRVPLLGFALEAAEATAKYAVSQAQPVANFFEGPIHLVDTIACKGIDVLETSVPAVNQPAEEVVKQARSYVAAKVQPTAELFSHVVDVGQLATREAVNRGMDIAEGGVEVAGAAKDAAMEAAGSLTEGAKDVAEFGMEKTMQAARFGKQTALEAMHLGREKTAEALEFGREKADRAVDFGREKAMKAARSQYGQMAAKQLDKAAVMVDSMTDKYMPPEVAEEVRRRGPVDVKRRTEEWEPKLRPLGHSMAIGERLFKKLISLFFWQFNMALSIASFFMMPMLHPLKFADMVITQTFKAPPAIVNFANMMFNFWMTIMNPWKLSYALFDIARGVQRRGVKMLRDAILFVYFHYVPEEIIQTARQTRTKLEQTKFTPPEFGETLPKGKKREEEEASEASGYHSTEEQMGHEERVSPRRVSPGKEQLERKGKEGGMEATPGPAGPKQRGKQQRPSWEYLRRDEEQEQGQGQGQGRGQPTKEQPKKEEAPRMEHAEGKKEEAPSAVAKPPPEQRKLKHEKRGERKPEVAFGESQVRKEAPSAVEDLGPRRELKERQAGGEKENVVALAKTPGMEEKPKEVRFPEEKPEEEDKENIGSRLWSGIKEMVTGGTTEEGQGETEGKQEEKPEEEQKKQEEQGQKPAGEGKIGFTVPTPGGEGGAFAAGDAHAGVKGEVGEDKAQIEGSFSSAAPGIGGEAVGKADLEKAPEQEEMLPGKKEHGEGEEEEHEVLRGGEEHPAHPHGHQKGRHHHHHEKGVKEDFHRYEDLSHDENWLRENMPSVPVDRKSPTHHDVVEEGVIPEALHELTDEDEATPGTSTADFAKKEGKQKQETTAGAGERQEPQDVGKEQQQQYQQEGGKVEMATPGQLGLTPPPGLEGMVPSPEEHGIGLGHHEGQGRDQDMNMPPVRKDPLRHDVGEEGGVLPSGLVQEPSPTAAEKTVD